MLDSDNLPLRNPEYLFESAEYKSSGSLFFSDWWDILDWVKPEAYTALGLQYPSFNRPTLAAESGQLLLNRWVASQASFRVYFLVYIVCMLVCSHAYRLSCMHAFAAMPNTMHAA